MKPAHALEVDLPTLVYKTALELATARGISLAEFAREAITEKAQVPLSMDLAAAYDSLADDLKGTNVEGFFMAQAETITE